MPLTPASADSFQLAHGEVHVWCASLDVPPGTSSRMYATLTPDERDRSARFRFGRDRQHFIVAHGVLRDLLGRYLETDAGRIRYVYNTCGKPRLAPELGSRITFNLSHSAGLALVAITADANVGVDLEYVRPQSDHAEIARRFFSRVEVEHLMALPNDLYAEAFFSCWTRKEAYLKACGEGLATPLDSFSVPLTIDPSQTAAEFRPAATSIVRAKRWSFHTLRPASGYLGSLAIEGRGWRLIHRHWPCAGLLDFAI